MNPLLPTGWEFFITVVGIIHVVLVLAVIFRVGFDKWLAPEHKIFLLIISLLVPIIGPAMSLLVTFRTNK